MRQARRWLGRLSLGEAARLGGAEGSQLLDFGRGSCREAHVGREERREDGHSGFRRVFLRFRGGEWKRQAGRLGSAKVPTIRRGSRRIHRLCLLVVFLSTQWCPQICWAGLQLPSRLAPHGPWLEMVGVVHRPRDARLGKAVPSTDAPLP